VGSSDGDGGAGGSAAGVRETRRLAQRTAMLQAAVELARVGGYDAVQMRDVAVAVGMSPGSVYNYFESKDHLLSTLMVDWTTAFARRIEERPPTTGTTVDRVVEVFHRASRTLAREQNFAEALLTAVRQHARASDDLAPKEAVNELLASAVHHAFGPEFPEADRREIVRVLSHVWYALLIGWSARWFTPDQMREEIRIAAERLIAPVEARIGT
jgi:TetR/AcrR family transcriptional regulator, cholesterol catabolism regulator